MLIRIMLFGRNIIKLSQLVKVPARNISAEPLGQPQETEMVLIRCQINYSGIAISSFPNVINFFSVLLSYSNCIKEWGLFRSDFD